MSNTPLITAGYSTPFGELNVFATPDDGIVRAAGFKAVQDVAVQLPTAVGVRGWDKGELPDVARAVAAWLEGDANALTAVQVEQTGGPFFQAVWAALRSLPGGQVVSYQELAELAGRPRAVRAAGTACARNAIAPFVPCHRVIQSGGRLGSYGFGGTDIKAAMLVHEGIQVESPRADARVAVTN